MKAVIVEDEQNAARYLAQLITKHLPDIEVLATLHSLKAAQDWLGAHETPNLLFLDIQLSDGVSFDLFEQDLVKCPVIFTTAYHEYMLRAFKVNSIDYLLKPIDKHELQQAVQKFRQFSQHFGAQVLQENMQMLLQNIRQPQEKKYKERFLVQARNMLVPVPASQVSYFEKDEVIFLHTADGKRWVTDFHSMDELEEVLNPSDFYRANRQFIVHIASVENVKPTHKGITAKLRNSLQHAEVDISREKAADFKRWLEQ